ncbi:MAG: cytochrome c biogenesis protein CcdA [Candidatus Pacearchaeota archaeon]
MRFNKLEIIYIILLLLSLLSISKAHSENVLSISSASTESFNNSSKNVYFFWGIGCPHCENVIKSGILEEIKSVKEINLYSLEIYNNQENREKYNYFANKLNIDPYQRGVPLAVIECGNKYSYLIGDKQIIGNLKDSIINCYSGDEIDPRDKNPGNSNNHGVTLSSIIIAAIIDSINPCAFGVLIFLLATMLSVSSPKKALRYGIIYSLIIFIVYFLVGLGIMKAISEFSKAIDYVILFTAIIIFIGGIIEIKDFFFYGKGISLKIPKFAKPLIEKFTKKGTIGAVIILGILVALAELPCTGGIYIAILSLMHVNKTFGVSYLLLYNLIFITPLLVIVLMVYYGTKTEKITNWIERNKKIMRLSAGIIMILLSLYLINSVSRFI